MPHCRRAATRIVCMALAFLALGSPAFQPAKATPPVSQAQPVDEDEDRINGCPKGPDGKMLNCRAETERPPRPVPATIKPPTARPAPPPKPAPRPMAPVAPPPAMAVTRGPTTGSASAMAVSYFQRGKMKLDTRNAFGMVIIPRRAVDDRDQAVQRQFCELVLSSLDFAAPGDIDPGETLATYWPIIADIDPVSLEMAFASHDCQNLIAWYDHGMARDIAAKTGLLDKGGPLLVTWPSERSVSRDQRDPLVVDFANANRANAKRALAYWFRQLSQDPSLWTDRIREGTIRAELADAINETAGVMLAVLSGKWEGLTEIPDGRS
jgi:hypothetical protein